MTEKQIQLVKESWAQVVPISETAGMLFYNRLFEVAPMVRSMFGDDLRPQARKLMSMLSMIVSKLDRLDTLLDEIKMLAGRHDKYGARPEHYEVVGNCLLWTLNKGLGDKWNNETEEAWVRAYGILSSAMIQNQNFGEEQARKAS